MTLAAVVGMQLGAWLLGAASAGAVEFCPRDARGQEQRTVVFENHCDFPVWIGFVGGSIACKTDASMTCPSATSICQPNSGSNLDGSCTCTQDVDCGTGRACNPDSKLCYWLIPTPTDANGVQSFKLDAANGGGTTTARSCVAQRSDLVQRLQSR